MHHVVQEGAIKTQLPVSQNRHCARARRVAAHFCGFWEGWCDLCMVKRLHADAQCCCGHDGVSGVCVGRLHPEEWAESGRTVLVEVKKCCVHMCLH